MSIELRHIGKTFGPTRVLDDVTLRLSPHGQAPTVAPVEGGSAVRIVGQGRGWVLVRAAGGREGWVPDPAVAAIGG